jgi:DNA mismatch endonuclease (patch repair protein)
MADRVTKEKRSEMMASVRSKGNKTTEGRIVDLFRKNKIVGWRRHNKKLPGTPDFSFQKEKVAIYVDGCFWHGCDKCYVAPKSNEEFWKKKIETNMKRDRANRLLVRRMGWKHVRIWEHEIRKNPERIMIKVRKSLTSAKVIK